MAPLAVPHRFLHVSHLCNNIFLHDFMGIEGEKVRCVSYVKQGALAETWAGVCASPFPHSPLPTSTTLTAPSRFLTLWSGLPWVCQPGWALITGRRLLWFDFCCRCSVERFALQLHKKKPYMVEGSGNVNSEAATVAPVSRRQMARAIYNYSAGALKISRLMACERRKMCNPLKCLDLHCGGPGSQSRTAKPWGAGLAVATHPFFVWTAHLLRLKGGIVATGSYKENTVECKWAVWPLTVVWAIFTWCWIRSHRVRKSSLWKIMGHKTWELFTVVFIS